MASESPTRSISSREGDNEISSAPDAPRHGQITSRWGPFIVSDDDSSSDDSHFGQETVNKEKVQVSHPRQSDISTIPPTGTQNTLTESNFPDSTSADSYNPINNSLFEPERLSSAHDNNNNQTFMSFQDPNMDPLKRARSIKAEIENNIAILQTGMSHARAPRSISDDPENQVIKRLRETEKMPWGEIATRLNRERKLCNEPADFTAKSVYSRFAMMTPRTAVSVHEMGFEARDYMYLRNPGQFSSTEASVSVSKVGKKRIKDYDNAVELKANMRQRVPKEEEEEDDLETPKRSEQLVEAVAKVERNFWLLVADELERATTKFYDPEALAKRYHAI